MRAVLSGAHVHHMGSEEELEKIIQKAHTVHMTAAQLF